MNRRRITIILYLAILRANLSYKKHVQIFQTIFLIPSNFKGRYAVHNSTIMIHNSTIGTTLRIFYA